MGALLRPACWLLGHTWSEWKRVGSYYVRECQDCDALQSVAAQKEGNGNG